jgi:hypothetical protein
MPGCRWPPGPAAAAPRSSWCPQSSQLTCASTTPSTPSPTTWTPFTAIYNTRRPHRSLPRRATPATIYAARPTATPGDRSADTHHRVRRDRIDASGVVTLRHHGRLHHIGAGQTHARTHVIMLIQDLHIRVINAATGELLRDLALDPARDYQPTGRPPGPPRGRPHSPRQRKNPEP